MSNDDDLQRTASRRRDAVSFKDEEEMLFGDGDPNPKQLNMQPSSDRNDGPPLMTSTNSQCSDAASGKGSTGLSRFKSKLQRSFGGAQKGVMPNAHLKHGLSIPLKNVFIRRGSNDDEIGRVSALSDSGPFEDDNSSSRTFLLEATSEWTGDLADSPSHPDDQNHEATVTEIDRGDISISAMYSINEGDASLRKNSGDSVTPASDRGKRGKGSNDNTSLTNSLDSAENIRRLSGGSSTVSDQFEDRMRAKMMEQCSHNMATRKLCPSTENKNTDKKVDHRKISGGSSTSSDRFGKAMKCSPSMENSAAAHHGTVGAQPLTAGDQFESRLRAKAMKHSPSMENAAAAHHRTVNEPTAKQSSTASGRFESRLKAKMEEGKVDNNTMKHSPSMENAARVHHRTFSEQSSTASGRFEGRLKAKMEEGKTDKKTMKHSPSMENAARVHHRTFSEQSSTASGRFEGRLKAKMEEGKVDNKTMKHSPSMENTVAAHYRTVSEPSSTAVGSASDVDAAHHRSGSTSVGLDYEDRVKRKISGGYVAGVDAGAAFITKCAAEGKCNDILQYLHDKPRSPPALVTVALEKIGGSFSSTHGIFDSTASGREIIILNDDWVKVLAVTTMSNHSANESVQLAALGAIWSIVALNSRYASEFTSSEEGLESLTMAMKTHQHAKQIQECGSGIVACLASNQHQVTLLLRSHNGSIVERLVEALCSHSCSGLALKALFRLLMTSQQSENLIETIGHCTNRERQWGDILTNAMDKVLGVISVCPKNTGVQIWGCRLLWALFSDERLLNSSVTGRQHNSLSTLTSNVLLHLEALTSPETPQTVHESAICLLSRISCCSDDLLAGKEEVFSRIVVRIILSQPKSRTVAVHGCHCISNVLYIQDDTASAILGVMKDFEEEEVADIAINSIALLTMKGFQAILTLLNNERLIDSIVGCMSRHSNSSSIQIAACNILSNIALDRHVMNDICSCGGTSRIITTLYNLSQDSLVVCKAFWALANIIGTCDAATLQKCKAPKSVLCAMEANPTDIFIQIRGATTLWSLGSCHSTLQKEIIQLGGIQTISEAMREFIASEQMQEKGIIALWSLSVSTLLESAVTSRAIEAIADAICAHLTSTQICEHGLGALSTLATTKSVVKDVDDVIDLIFSCMMMHSDSATVQQGALAALSKISIDQPSNEVLQITPDDLDVVINAMRTHILVKGVQENAIILLRSMSFCAANINVIGQNPFLVGLIKTAMSKFQGSLRVNVEDLLRMLPSDNQ